MIKKYAPYIILVAVIVLAVAYWVTTQQKSSVPSLDAAVVYGAKVPEGVRTALGEKITAQRQVVRENMGNKYAWVNLALFYAIAQDWEATEAAWLYVNDLYPNDTELLNYIGNFYRNESHTFDLAEQYYRKSLAVDIAQPGVYAELHYLYSQQYKTDTRDAETVLLEAEEVLPFDPTFPYLLGLWYTKHGEVESARTQLLLARPLAIKVEAIDLAAAIDKELDALPKSQ
ncbi:MAG: hypothetical protein AAB573_02535 [Patescibacteria group bacterium]